MHESCPESLLEPQVKYRLIGACIWKLCLNECTSGCLLVCARGSSLYRFCVFADPCRHVEGERWKIVMAAVFMDEVLGDACGIIVMSVGVLGIQSDVIYLEFL